MFRSYFVRRLALLLGIWPVLVAAADDQRPLAIAQLPPMTLAEGWQLRWGDSPVDDAGRFVWAHEDFSASGWQPVTELINPNGRQDRQFVWLRVRVPSTPWPYPVLYLSNVLLACEVFLDGRKIYQVGTLVPSVQNKYLTATRHTFPIPGDYAGKVLTLRIFSDSKTFIGLTEWPRIGSQADVIRAVLLKHIDNAILGVLFLFIGLFALFLYVNRRDQRRVEYLSFGAFAFCMGIGPVLFSQVFQWFVYAPFWVYYIGHMAFFLFPVGMFAFLAQMISPGPRGVMRYIWRFHLAFAVFSLILDALDIWALPEMQVFLLGILAVDVVILFWVEKKQALRVNAETRILNIGGGILGLSGLHDILESYGIIPEWHYIFQWGTFVFAIFLGYILERQFTANHRRLLVQTKELAKANRGLRDEISERKKAEEELRSANAEVARLTRRLQAENVYLQEEIKLEHNFEEIITRSAAFKAVLRKVEQVASTDATVLILGQTGTGKELLARAVHDISARRNRPLVKVNCAALPASLIESELFGHEKGAFTGALARKVGRFEFADGGTIFLDEIGDLPLELQAKLLRVLQEGEFERLGSSQTLTVDVRVIAATNRDLEAAISEGDFREDLYYRLNVFPVHIPPLKERKDDIPVLVQHFISKHGAKAGKKIGSVSPEVMARLQAYDWPGNVRELENVIERALVLCPGDQLVGGDWMPSLGVAPEPSAKVTLEDMERNHILRVLELTGGKVGGENGAAKILGLKRTTLQARMRKLGIAR